MDSYLAEIESICRAIEANQEVDNPTLFRYLCNDDAGVRLEANYRLACTYLHKLQDVNKALVYAKRAFMLSGLDERYPAFYLEILNTTGDVDKKRAIYKEMGCRFSEIGDVVSALRYFELHRDAYYKSGMGDHYEYDFDVLKRIRDLAALYRRKVQKTTPPMPADRIRLAYLVFGITHSNSVIVALMTQYARYHDASQFEVVFFIVESSLNNSETARHNIGLLESAGAKVVQASSSTQIECLLEAAREINNFGPDILISTAILANYAHYFVYSLIEKVNKISFCFGPPEQYIPPDADGVMCPTVHPAIDSMRQTTLVPIEFDLSQALITTPVSRESMGLPNDSVVIVAAGRPTKFLNKEYWKAIFATLNSCENVYFVAIGLSVMPPFFSEILPEKLAARVKVLGWLDGYLKVLKLADIVVDTFPSGGGVVLIEAMASDIPTITFQEDYSCPYNQMNWNPGAEIVPMQELILPRWDFVALEQKLIELVNKRDLRVALGASCGQEARLHRGNPERSVKRCEIFLMKFLKDRKALTDKYLQETQETGLISLQENETAPSSHLVETALGMQHEMLRLRGETQRLRDEYSVLYNSRGMRVIRLFKKALGHIGMSRLR